MTVICVPPLLARMAGVVAAPFAAAAPAGDPTRLVISSGGGDTVEGRHVGRWVRDRALVVEVDVTCFSSCAVCAVGDVLEMRPGDAGQIGWGFSLADMARLGLANTVYLGEGRDERDSARFRPYLVPISADECLALLK